MNWLELRDQFPVTKNWAFFDHAAVAPLPVQARDAMSAWAEDVANHGIASVARWSKRIEEVRGLAAQLLNADSHDIAFIKNTSEGISFVAEGFPWQAGDNMVTVADEYPSNVYPWMNIAERGVDIRQLPTRQGRIAIEDLAQAMDNQTRLVSLSFVEFGTGFRNDLLSVGQLCRDKGVFFFVDAIQGLGVFPLDVSNCPIDFLSADGHKWLLGPEGAGIFWIRRELVETLHTVSIGWNSVVNALDFSHIDFRLKPHAGRWESGAFNVAGISALGASIDLLLHIGLENVERRVLELTDYLCEGASKMGLEVYSSRQPGEKSGIVSLLTPGQDPVQLVKHCRGHGIIVNQRGGRLRVSPHCYNSVEEMDHLLAVLAEYCGTK